MNTEVKRMNDESFKRYELTHPQKRIWYYDKMYTNTSTNNIGGCLILKENINLQYMKDAIEYIILENDGVRMRIIEDNGKPFQYISHDKSQIIDYYDYSNSTIDKIKEWIDMVFEAPFSIENNKLYYFAIYKIDEYQYGVLVKLHHLIADGWSFSVILHQILSIYDSFIKNSNQVDVFKRLSYVDFVKEEEKYLTSNTFEKNKKYWIEIMKYFPQSNLYSSMESCKGRRKDFYISQELYSKMMSYCIANHISLNLLFISAVFIYQYKVTNNGDLVIGVPIHNRTSRAQKEIVGMFTSTMPLRMKLQDNMEINTFLKVLKNTYFDCLKNQRYPYDSLIREMKVSEKKYDSLFKLAINYYQFDFEDQSHNFVLEDKYSGNQSYSCQIVLKEWDKTRFTISIDYKVAEYDDNLITSMYQSIINIISHLISTSEQTIADIKLLDKDEILEKVNHIGNSQLSIPNQTISKMIEDQVKLTPDRIALDYEGRKVTYQELEDRTNQLANYLVKHGIQSNDVIGIRIHHSCELVITIYAVMKVGGIYTPIDPNYPNKRIKYILNDSKCKLLLTDRDYSDELCNDIEFININKINMIAYSKQYSSKNLDMDNLAYIIFTSGSTGRPKGVMVTNIGLANYICWANKTYIENENDSIALYSSISFDLTVTSLFMPLISGNKIVIYQEDENEFILNKIVRDNKVTIVKLTPAHLSILKDDNLIDSQIRCLIVGGDNLSTKLAKDVHKSFGGRCKIYNEYGPTEAVVGCMTYLYQDDRTSSVPIGYPIDNVQIYILDKNLNIVPNYVSGEIYISGICVSKGYIHNKQLTSERFIPNPYKMNEIMYKTGDAAKYIENNYIEYEGRLDKQIKIRGFRIELNEIEKCLLEHKAISEVYVRCKNNNVLIAYIVKKQDISEKEIKEWLSELLPNYMIPSFFITLDYLPLTINGKIDESVLPEISLKNNKIIECNTDNEIKLIETLKKLLCVENISLEDSFYQLGGDSIKAIQISSMLRNYKLELSIKDILNSETIKDMAAYIKNKRKKIEDDQSASIGSFPNTPIVQWFFEQEFKNPDHYSQYVILELEDKIKYSDLKIAINALIAHHDTLRLNYSKENQQLFYNPIYLKEKYSPLIIREEEECENCNTTIEYLKKISFDIEQTLLFQTISVEKAIGQSLIFVAHHLVIDGISWRILIEDFFSIIKQIREEKEVQLPYKTCSYKRWAEHLVEYSNNDEYIRNEYWNMIQYNKMVYPMKDQFSVKDTEHRVERVVRTIPENILVTLIENASKRYNMDLYETIINVLVITLSQQWCSNFITLQLEHHGRIELDQDIDISRTVGWFTSLFPACFQIQNNEVIDCIKSLKEQIHKIPQGGVNYGIQKYIRKCLNTESGEYVKLNYLGDFDSLLNNSSVSIKNIDFGLDSDNYYVDNELLDIEVIKINKELRICFSYNYNKLSQTNVASIADNFITLLEKYFYQYCEKSITFTPSDFDMIDITQQEIDNLFI